MRSVHVRSLASRAGGRAGAAVRAARGGRGFPPRVGACPLAGSKKTGLDRAWATSRTTQAARRPSGSASNSQARDGPSPGPTPSSPCAAARPAANGNHLRHTAQPDRSRLASPHPKMILITLKLARTRRTGSVADSSKPALTVATATVTQMSGPRRKSTSPTSNGQSREEDSIRNPFSQFNSYICECKLTPQCKR
jgi:hypothetical protein